MLLSWAEPHQRSKVPNAESAKGTQGMNPGAAGVTVHQELEKHQQKFTIHPLLASLYFSSCLPGSSPSEPNWE